MELYEDYGISAYTLGTANQPMLATYAWLQECYKTQKIKTAVVDVAALYYGTVKEARYHQALDNMKLSFSKIQTIYEHCKLHENADPFFSYIFRIAKYHSRWNSLTEDDFTTDTDYQPVFRGNVLYSDRVKVNFDAMAYDNDTPQDDLAMNADQLDYFEKIIAFCEEKGIQLLLIKTPRYDWSITKHQQVEAYAKERGLEFLDFSSREMLEAVGLDAENDFLDKKHLNIDGTVKLSEYIGAYLKENYELTDFREVEGYDELNYKEYLERIEDGRLQRATESAEYLQYLNNERYDILLQTTADVTGKCTSMLLDTLASFQLQVDINTLNGNAYVAQVNSGTCAYEGMASQKFAHSGYLSDGVKYSLYGTYASSTSPAITVNYEKYGFTGRGVNILVYDNQKSRVVDCSTLCYSEEDGTMVLLKENEPFTM